MSEAYTTPEELFADQEAILARITRCQALLGSAIFRARVALGIEPTTQAFFHDQVSWAKRGAVTAPAPVNVQKIGPDGFGPPATVAAPPPVAVAPPTPTVVTPPPRVEDTPEVLAGFTTRSFFGQQVAWTGGSAGAVSPPPRRSLFDQLVPGPAPADLPTALPPPPVEVMRPAPPPIDYTMAAGTFFRTVPWKADPTSAAGTRPDSGNFLAAATESALRTAQRLSTKPAP